MNEQLSLQQLVMHFFDSRTSYESKKQIEQRLMNIRQQPDTWIHCITAMQQNQHSESAMDPNMLWFCLSVLEELIHRNWDTISTEDQYNVRVFLLRYLESADVLSKRATPFYVLNKLIKTIADTAKRTWPADFPELFETVQRMIFERKTRTRGLTLLKVCCEEFVAGKNDVQTSRRRQLREALHTQVPHVLVLVKQILDEALNKPNSGCHQRSSSARNGDATAVQSSSPYRLLSISTAPENQSSMMADTFVGPLSPQYTIFRPPVGNFDTETLDNCLLCLEIVTQLFSWIPLEQHLSLPLLSTILQYTMLNDSFDAPLGCQALSCIIEFLTRKCMPKALDEYLMLIFRYMIDSLRHFIIEADNFVIDDLDEDYRIRFTECLTKYVQHHIYRMENITELSVHLFLEGVSKYTFEQPNVYAFRECLVLWTEFIKHVLNTGAASKYRTILLPFGIELLRKVQYLENPSYLNDLEDGLENVDGLTEFDQFIDEVILILKPLSEFYPGEMIGDLHRRLERTQEAFQALVNAPSDASRSMEGTAGVYYAFKDMKTYLRLFGMLAEMFFNSFESSFQTTFTILQQFLLIIHGCMRLVDLHGDSADFIKLYNESYMVYNAYMPWICAFKQRSCGVPELEQQFDSLCSNIIEACLLIIRKDTPKEIICPPANVFRAICIQVKPKKLFVYPKIGDLLANIHTLSMDLPRDAKRDIYIGVSLACLELFSKNDQLSQEYQSFIHGVTQPLLQISTHPQFPACALTNENQPKLIHVLTVLSALIESIQGERQSSKIVVLEAIKDVLPMCLALFEHTATHTELQLSIMDLFLKLFASLQKQISSETVAHVTQTFMGGLSGDRLQRLLDCSGQTGIELINRLFMLLKIMAQDNTRAFELFLPAIVQFTLQCAPVMQRINESEAIVQIAASFYGLIHAILIQNMKYFFPRSDGEDPRLQELTGLLTAMIAAFQSTNLEICKVNLDAIGELSTKTRLFHQPYFLATTRAPFSITLLCILAEKSHDSLRDDFITALYRLAVVDIYGFYSDLLVNFINEKSAIDDRARQSVLQQLSAVEDLPTFSAQIGCLIDDISYYRFVQAPIPVAPPV